MSFPGDVQIPLSPPGSMTVDYLDNNGAPASVVAGEFPVQVVVKWGIPQSLANIISPNSAWRVEVYADQLGGPFDGVLNSALVPTVAGQTSYSVVIACSVAAFDNPGPGKSSLLHFATAITLSNNGLETELGGFADGPTLRVM
jgi:hypothetical protein